MDLAVLDAAAAAVDRRREIVAAGNRPPAPQAGQGRGGAHDADGAPVTRLVEDTTYTAAEQPGGGVLRTAVKRVCV